MTIITYFVHGTTTDNENRIATGWLPGELSPKGLEQARQLKDQAADKTFDLVFCSDLHRAIQTATIAFRESYEIIHDERLREADYGEWNGKPHTFKYSMQDYVDQPFPSGESYHDVEVRLRSFCEYLKKDYAGKHIAIVAHQAPQLALDVILGGKTWELAIEEDWRKTGSWQPGWTYTIE